MKMQKPLVALFVMISLVLGAAPLPASAATPAAGASRAAAHKSTSRAQAAQPDAQYVLTLSRSSDRSNSVSLEGQTVSGDMFVFISPSQGITGVHFYIDNPTATGAPWRSEYIVPWDLAGSRSEGATPFDTSSLGDGSHNITAVLDLDGNQATSTAATFTVNNSPAGGGSVYWGVSMPGLPSDVGALSNWESNVTGKGASIVHWGVDWADSGWSNAAANSARGHGSIPMISWTPEGGDPAQWQLRTIINGQHDGYIQKFATDARNWGHPFFLRIMHEMNGAWGYPWQEDSNGNHRGEFVQAWRHIVDIFRQVGVTNASYVWCPNKEYPNSPDPTYASLYPGDGYVDWTCLDAYNWGTNRPEGWETFDKVFGYSYDLLRNVAPSKPVMFGEFASAEQGGSKADWFSDLLNNQLPGKYSQVRAFVYFNWVDKNVDWRIESSAAAANAWRAGIGSGYYSSNSFGGIDGTVPVP